MTESSPSGVETIFHQALKRPAGAERGAYLDGACGSDRALRTRVEALLSAHAEAHEFLEPAGETTGGAPHALAVEGPGTRIGPYKLLQKIGEGGMGVVYMAEQQEPVRRKVALKIIKLGMDTRAVIARFEAERQALALMSHPNIAQVLDAGATETGRPYFVMELVRGVPISEYCDTQGSATDERLALFIDVCRAVQHAHQKGIIHRDLKPTNVLVTNHDGKPVPKIIDFGVAKATHQRLTEKTLFTEFQQFIGTPEYMSPEQAEMSGLDVDTRTDVYSLGVLLYQLLTGTTPVDGQLLRERGLGELTRILREQEPTAPSTQVSRLGERSMEIARRRGSEPGALARLFRGDLDWIVMKALEKDRTRRYDTAAALADDVQRHLSSQPVLAGPPSAVYKLRKFAHRNRKLFLAGSLAAAALLLGLIGTSLGFVSARREAARSKRIADSLQGILASFDPSQAEALSVDLERTLQTARSVFGEDHAAVAACLSTLAVQLENAGLMREAEPLYREALERWERIHGRQHVNVATASSRLGRLLYLLGEDVAAEEHMRESLAILRSLPGPVPVVTGEVAEGLAELLEKRAQYEEAISLLREAVEVRRASSTGQSMALIGSLERLFFALFNAQRPSEAEEVLREIYDLLRRADPDGPFCANAAFGLGNFLSSRGRPDEAEPYLREALASFRNSERPPAGFMMACLDGLFQALRSRTDLESRIESDAIVEEILVLARPMWGAEKLASNKGYLAGRYLERGLHFDALRHYVDLRTLAEENPGLADRLPSLNDAILRCAAAVPIDGDRTSEELEFALAALEGADPGSTETALWQWTAARGGLLYRLGRHEQAVDTLQPLLDHDLRYAPARARPWLRAGRALLGLGYARLGRWDEAGEVHAELADLEAGEDLDEPGVRLLVAELESLIAEKR